MKNLIYSLAAILVLFIFDSCKKEDSPKPQSLISGKWQWQQSVGGFSGSAVLTPATEGYTRHFNFGKDSVSITRNDTVFEDRAAFHLTYEKSILYHTMHDFLTIDYHFTIGGDSVVVLPLRYIIKDLKPDKMVLTEDVFDGFEITLAK